MKTYKLTFLPEFIENLEETIHDWKTNHYIGPAKSRKHVHLIRQTIELLKTNPYLGQKVTQSYALSLREPTRRLVIGKYIVFYRVNVEKHLIYIGSFFYHTRKNVLF